MHARQTATAHHPTTNNNHAAAAKYVVAPICPITYQARPSYPPQLLE
jgi:hypothetical protein